MIICLIICLTIIFCTVYLTLWVKHMVTHNLPMFTYGECVWKDTTSEADTTHPVGFIDTAETTEPVVEEKKPTVKEQKEALMQDPTTLLAALLRGEVDIDDIRI